MKQIISRIFVFLMALLLGHRALNGTQPMGAPSLANIDSQVESLAPAAVLRSTKNLGDVQFDYVSADLAGTGAYNYYVASYDLDGGGEKIRILRNINGKVYLAGVLDPSDKVEFVGFPTTVQVVYVDNSGIPAIEIQNLSVDGRHFGFDLLRWTGTGLVSMFPADASMVDSYLADPRGSGIPEVINPPYCERGECNGLFEVYELKRGVYVRTATSTSDPSGLIPPPGKRLPLPEVVTAQPSQFSAADILASATKKGTGADVVVRIGNLASMNGDSSGTDVSEVDLSAIYAGRSLKPSRVRIVSSTEGKAEGFDGAFIEITLPRTGVLQYLARAEPSGPPAPGDAVTIPIHARLRSGVALYGFAPVRIGDPAAQ
jgi:hypothetical protein